MVRDGEIGLEDIKRVVRKHWWVVPAFAVICAALGLLVAMQLPKKFRSETLVLVAKPTVPIDIVKPVVTEDLNQRLASMKQQILSRTRLEPVLDKFDIYREERKKVQVEDLVERLRAAIEISPLEPMAGTQDRTMAGFNVSVTLNNAQTAQQIKAFNETLLSQQEGNWKASRKEKNPETTGDQLRVLQDQLNALESKYTAEHPDVIKTRNQINDLKTKMAEERNAGNPSTGLKTVAEPPQMQQLRALLRQDEINIADLTKRLQQIQEQSRVLEARLQAVPGVEQQLKELTRNYQSALDFYNELLKKHDNSAMATDLAHQQEGEQFRVLDPPSLPMKPSFPKLINFAGGGLCVGLALGVGILYMLIAMDQTLHTEREVELYLKVPVLASLPIFDASALSAKNGDVLKPSVVQIN